MQEPVARRTGGEAGTAVVEFIVVAVLLLVPLAYGIASIMRVQAASEATVQAAREAGRAFVTADSPVQGRWRAEAAARLAFTDQGFEVPGTALRIECGVEGCLTPGSEVTVLIDWRVPLPWMPAGLFASAEVPIAAEHKVPVDVYRLSA